MDINNWKDVAEAIRIQDQAAKALDTTKARQSGLQYEHRKHQSFTSDYVAFHTSFRHLLGYIESASALPDDVRLNKAWLVRLLELANDVDQLIKENGM